MNIETLSAKHMNMGFLDVLGELTEVGLTPTEAIREHSNIISEMNGQIWVALEENVVIGTASIHILPKFVHQCGHVAIVEDVVVADNNRGKYIGHQLMIKAVSYAIEKDCYKMILNCDLNNIQFYEKCGFHSGEYQMRMDLQ